MALPQSPQVVVIENDASIYTPNVNSSVVGIVGFADKGPINEATLVTSQNDLLNKFGRPNSNIPGQGLEGALEILEATNQIYYVRCASGSQPASAVVPLGFAPSVHFPVSAVSALATDTASSIVYTVVDNNGVAQTASKVVTLTSSTGATTVSSVLLNYFNQNITGDSDVFAALDSSGSLFLASRYPGASATLLVSAQAVFNHLYPVLNTGGLSSLGAAQVFARGGLASGTISNASSLYLKVASKYDGLGYNLSSLRDGSVQGISVEVENISLLDRISVNSEGVENENYDVQLSPSSLQSVEYILNTDIDNNQSDLINAEIQSNTAAYTQVPNNIADPLGSGKAFMWNGLVSNGVTPRFIKIIPGTYGLVSGNSGYSNTEVGNTNDITALIGNSASKTGMYALDYDGLEISMALVPGITHQQVQNALITLGETSKNFVSIVSPPYGLDTVQDAVD